MEKLLWKLFDRNHFFSSNNKEAINDKYQQKKFGKWNLETKTQWNLHRKLGLVVFVPIQSFSHWFYRVVTPIDIVT